MKLFLIVYLVISSLKLMLTLLDLGFDNYPLLIERWMGMLTVLFGLPFMAWALVLLFTL